MEDCKHEKPVTKLTSQSGVADTGIAIRIVQLCKNCNSTRVRESFSFKIGPKGGFTGCSEDVGPWIPENTPAPVV